MGQSLGTIPLARPTTAVCAGRTHTCAITDDKSLRCWGDGAFGMTGHGDVVERGTATGDIASLDAVNLGTDVHVESVSCGSYHTCALLTGGVVKCWGNNSDGQLGLGNTLNRGDSLAAGHGMGDLLPPLDFGSGRLVAEIATGEYHSCARFTTGEVKCWGLNDAGQLGQGSVANAGDSSTTSVANMPPIDLGTGRRAARIASGRRHVCALLDDGMVKCWGANGNGQLGVGTIENRGDAPGEMGDALQPVAFGSGSAVVDISAGFHETCARFVDKASKCWGYNAYGQLGQGSVTNVGSTANSVADARAIVLPGSRTALQLSAGGGVFSAVAYGFACTLLDDSSLACFGHAAFGELGNGIASGAPVGTKPADMGDALARTLVP
jgi:alpha-tubulin suppressor-like RCC1 family protein